MNLQVSTGVDGAALPSLWKVRDQARKRTPTAGRKVGREWRFARSELLLWLNSIA